MKQNERGSILVWAVVMILVLVILVGAGLSISFSYFNRSLQYEVKQQVFYSAESGIDAVVKAINESTDAVKSKLIPVSEDKDIVIKDIAFLGDETQMGTISAKISWIKDNYIKITVSSAKDKQEYTLYADLVQMYLEDGKTKVWRVYQMYDDNTVFTTNEEVK